jgi:hypothetical protein
MVGALGEMIGRRKRLEREKESRAFSKRKEKKERKKNREGRSEINHQTPAILF